MLAFPDDAGVRRLAENTLRNFRARLSPPVVRALAGSGVVGSRCSYAFEHPIADWLRRVDPEHIEIDWKECDEEKIQKLLPILTGLAEEPGIEDEDISTEEWIRAAAGKKSGLVWLLDRLRALKAPPRTSDYLYDAFEIPIAVRFEKPALSRTGAWRKMKEIFFHAEPLHRGPVDLRAELARPLAAPTTLSGGAASALVSLARASLTAREREIYPISHADVRDVAVYPLERGLEIATFGVIPARRMILEGLWGYLLLKNGVPIGYGCFSCVFESSEIAFNIFDSFRHGEAALTYAALLRVIHRHTGATSFSVMKYQFGDENAEAIKSGAFWFYHKLGFRPMGEKLRREIDAEVKRLKARSGRRTDAKTLRRFATEHLYFHLGEENRFVLGNLRYAKAGHLVTAYVSSKGGDRALAVREARAQVVAALKADFPRHELDNELCLLLAQIPALAAWPYDDKIELARIVDAKSAPSERDAVLRMNRHVRFRAAILAVVPRIT